MPDDPRDEPEAADNDDFREMLREFLSGDGDMDPAKLASAAGLPSDPALVARLIGQLQDALTNTTDGVNWDLALEQATTLAARGAVPSTTDERAVAKCKLGAY